VQKNSPANQPVSDLPKGARLRLTHVQAGQSAARLMEMGLVPGVVITVLRRAPMGDPLEIAVGGARLALRREEAASLEGEIIA